MPQSLSSILIHLVFSTKNREPFITAEIEHDLHDYLGGIFRRCECPSLLVGGTADHIHALFVLSRTKTVASVVEDVKVGSSKWIKTKGEAFQSFQWQTGYGAFSVSQSGLRKCVATSPIRNNIITSFRFRMNIVCYARNTA